MTGASLHHGPAAFLFSCFMRGLLRRLWPARSSNSDLAADFDDLVGGQFEDIGDAHGIARHSGKDGRLPTRDGPMVFARHDDLVTDVENHVFAVDFDIFGSARFEDAQNTRTFHESVTGFDAPEFVGDALDLQPLA